MYPPLYRQRGRDTWAPSRILYAPILLGLFTKIIATQMVSGFSRQPNLLADDEPYSKKGYHG